MNKNTKNLWAVAFDFVSVIAIISFFAILFFVAFKIGVLLSWI
jgi:hypothetical protein